MLQLGDVRLESHILVGTGKYTDFEGGTSVAAFVGGGYLPASVRGSNSSAIIHICDWHLTFSKLAGACLLYTSPSPRDKRQSRMPSSA